MEDKLIGKKLIEESRDDDVSISSGWQEAEHDVPKLPAINVERDYIIAKSYLQSISCGNETAWDHLNDIINHVLAERPPDCMRYFEDLSRELRIKKFFLTKDCEDDYPEIVDDAKEEEESKQLLHFYRRVECLYESDAPFDDPFGTIDYFPFFKLLNEAGIGFPYTDVYNIQMSMRLLAKTRPVAKLKLWGKVLGTKRDYIIVEAELTPEAMDERLREFTDKQIAMRRDTSIAPPATPSVSLFFEAEEQEEGISEQEFVRPVEQLRKLDTYIKPPLPQPFPKEEIIVPPEPPGQGLNRKVYYVVNKPSDEWQELPDVTPQQIVVARQIHKFLTGILTNEVAGYPEFPGYEVNLLRAQIARITSSTHSSPLGFYSTGGEEENIVVEEGQLFSENLDYQPLPPRDLLDTTFEFWVHHEPYILPQGRVDAWRPPSDYMENEGEFGEGEEQAEMESGPHILSSLSGDTMQASTPPWSVRRASTLLNEASAIVLRSNLWPGALTAVKERLVVNFYTGWATKYYTNGFNPYLVSTLQPEYELGPEIMEMTDPTVEMEEKRWLQLHPQARPADIYEGEIEDEEEIDEEPSI